MSEADLLERVLRQILQDIEQANDRMDPGVSFSNMLRTTTLVDRIEALCRLHIAEKKEPVIDPAQQDIDF
jgi:hypothetical protein